jgi:phosphatidylserine/phosphatidylglycerophosphate/cardiolipin synthase-like enzyme
MFLDVQRPLGDASSANEILRMFADRFRTSEWPASRLPDAYYDRGRSTSTLASAASLHAKCVVIDRRLAFVSSANFTEAAQIRNIEVGVLLRSAPVAAQLATQFETLAANGTLARVPGI